MKNYVWLRHNIIILINLCVISVMLWLTVSFLVLAVSERAQARLLSSSVATQEIWYDTAGVVSAIARQAGSGLSGPENTRQNSSESDEYRLAQILTQSDSAFAATRELINQGRYDLHSRYSAKSVEEMLLDLESILAELEKARPSVFSETEHLALGAANESVTSGEARQAALISHRKILMKISAISDGVAYLPNSKASEIAISQGIVAELMAARYVSSQIQLAMNINGPGNHNISGQASISLDELKAKVIQCLDRIRMLSLSLDSFPQLSNKSQQLQTWYQTSFQGQPDSTNSVSGDPFKNPQLHIALVEHLDDLASAGFEALRLQAKEQLNRANRNIAIDVALIFLSLLVVGTTLLLNKRIKFLAYKDSLTGLSNRVSFEHWLTDSTGGTQHSRAEKHSVLYIDLDRFKSVNDNYGHEFGDELLQNVAKRMREICGSNAVIARLGGDEFGVLLRNVESESDVMQLADNVIAGISQEFNIREHAIRIGASVGVSFYPEDGDDGIKILNNADIAMFHNKESDQNHAHRFNAEVAECYQRRRETELDLKIAVKNNEFKLSYQPKVCVETGRAKSVEALLRWEHKKYGYISPAEFIPVAEELGMMEEIGSWVLNTACMQVAELHRTHGLDFYVAVNISSQQFRDERFESKVRDALKMSGLRYDQLELEVTESLLMDDQERVISVLENLRELGTHISIDDFGTGFSSLQYLQQLPLDTLKIDRAFITALDDVNPADSVANSIVQLAALFNLDTVAEGVETEEQDSKIRSLGVNHIQGYLYSKPVAFDALAQTLLDMSSDLVSENNLIDRKAA